MPPWLLVFLILVAGGCTAVILFAAYVEVVDRRRKARELDRHARPFPPSIFDRRNPLHPIGTPPVDGREQSR
jgi:hypothetical protein